MDLLDAICSRRSVRHYNRKCPSDDVLRQLIEAAGWAPSAMNVQTWHFTVITRRQLLDRIARQAKIWIRENEAWASEDQELRMLLTDPNFDMLHHAPVLIVLSAPAAAKWTAEACAVAAQNLMLAATGLGLGSCWIGLAQDWLNSPEGKKAIGLPAHERVIAPLVVGYASENPEVLPRRKPVITWIGDETPVFENRKPADPAATHGLFGGRLVSV